MKICREIFFDEQRIKDILLAIKDTNDHFDVTIKNEESWNCNAKYKRRDKLILLFLSNYNSNNELVQCAIHEYAHHLMGNWVGHETEFWNCYFELLEIAEKKGFYVYDIDKSPKLKIITEIIIQNDLVKRKKIFTKDTGLIFLIIKKLCDKIDLDFQYYTVKYLKMEWYKKKNPLLSYGNFYRNYVLYRSIFTKINQEEFIQKFLNDFSKKNF